MKDITESARVAARETAITLWRLVSVLFFGVLLSIVGASLVFVAFCIVRWLQPNLSMNVAITISVMVMILPIAAVGWFGILFSIEYEERRKRGQQKN